MPTKNKIFIPSELEQVDPDHQFTGGLLLSGNYFKIANELRGFSKNNNGKHPDHYYVFPSVVLYMAAVEAYLQEIVALSIERAADEDIIECLTSIKNQAPPYNNFKLWVRKIYSLHDPQNIGIDTNADTYQNLIALKKLRNAVLHYNQEFIPNVEWPDRLQEVVRRSKIQVTNSDWASNLSSPCVSDWAHDTAREVVQNFYEMSGIAYDVFEAGEHFR